MKRGLRKAVALLSTVGVVCAMSIGVLAAGSPALNNGTGTDANGNAVEVTVGQVDTSDAAVSEAVGAISTDQGLADILGDAYTEGMAVASVSDVTVPDGTAFPVELTFEYPGITPDTNVVLLHWTGTAWEVIPTVAGDGVITGTFSKLSPVAVVIGTSGEVVTPGDDTTTDGTTTDSTTTDGGATSGTASESASGTTSPKTGVDNSMLMFAGLTAVIALAGVCVLKTREVA